MSFVLLPHRLVCLKTTGLEYTQEMAKDSFKALSRLTKRALIDDPELNSFLRPEFPIVAERKKFIRRCLRRMKTRRMLLRAHWYTDIADHQRKFRGEHDPLSIIFLVGIAEALGKRRVGNRKLGSWKAILDFFKNISAQDKKELLKNFQRSLSPIIRPRLRFSSIVRIFYDIRNAAVHGDDHYSFTLMRSSDKKKYISENYNKYGVITSAKTGKNRHRQKRVMLDTSLTYQELRSIFVRTALENIKASF